MSLQDQMRQIIGPDFEVDNTRQPLVLTEHNPRVEAMLTACTNVWETTADACMLRAKELREEAIDLEERARVLREGRSLITSVRDTIDFEIESRNRAASLALIKPSE